MAIKAAVMFALTVTAHVQDYHLLALMAAVCTGWLTNGALISIGLQYAKDTGKIQFDERAFK